MVLGNLQKDTFTLEFPFRDFGTGNLKLFNLLLILSLCFHKYSPQNNLHQLLFVNFPCPGNFFYINKGFSGTDIYHSDIKNALLQI